MRHALFILFALLAAPSVAFAADYKYGEPIAHENLTIVPVYPAEPLPDDLDDYLTFSEASDSGLIKVTELNGSTSDAQVSAVHVTSKADKPIILLAGEVILGGKQDRIISTNTIVEPGTKKLRVSVFCVEEGRWDGRQAGFQASKKVAHRKLRKAAIFEENQQKVWDEVAEQNEKSKVAPGTGTYRATLEKGELARRVETMTRAVLPRLAADARAIGVVVAIDAKIRSVDAFANPRLFAKVREQLVKSYVLAAVTSKKPNDDALEPAELAGLNDKIADNAGAAERTKPSGEADNVYYDKADKKRAVTRSKDGKKVHDFVSFE